MDGWLHTGDIAYCREHLAAYKVPRSIEFRPQLPRSAVGKALPRVLRDEEVEKMQQSQRFFRYTA